MSFDRKAAIEEIFKSKFAGHNISELDDYPNIVDMLVAGSISKSDDEIKIYLERMKNEL